jgi:hypothetical protein
MQTVIRTPTFLSDAKAAGLSDDEQNDIVSEISKNPTAGVMMEGTGGMPQAAICRQRQR